MMYLPAGWTPRPEQVRLYNETVKAFADGKRVVIMDAPTGLGKSAVARALLNDYGTGVVITATKQLQQQYIRDFPEMSKLVGRGNFECVLGNASCDAGFYRRNPNKRSRSYCQNCPYQEHVAQALGAEFYVANYASALWTASADYQRGILVIDEGHRTETELLQALCVNIPQKWWEQIDFSPPDDPDDTDELFAWVEDFLEELKEQRYSLPHPAEVDRLVSSIDYLIKSRDRLRWVAQGVLHKSYDNYIEFKPLRISRREGARLLNKGEKVLIMSATILNPDEMARNLGLRGDEWAYVSSNEAFDPETRPVHYIGHSLPITRDTMDEGLEWLTEAIQLIMDEHPEDKGLVHTSSTKIALHLKENLDDPEERLLLAYGAGRQTAYRLHLRRTHPTILLSPSMTEGVDLKDDLARFIVIAKCPYMSLGDKQVSERARIDREWYLMHTVRQVIQAAGRGNRNPEDQCTTFILDEKVNEVLEEFEEYVPEWFWDAWEEI